MSLETISMLPWQTNCEHPSLRQDATGVGFDPDLSYRDVGNFTPTFNAHPNYLLVWKFNCHTTRMPATIDQVYWDAIAQ